MVANRTVFGTSWREQECLDDIKCRQRFRYPGRHEQACSNDTLRFRTLVDLRCQHPCEAAFFHRIESCFQPLYPLLSFARDKGFGVLVERRGFFASELEHLFWRSWHPTSVLLKYDDFTSRHGMEYVLEVARERQPHCGSLLQRRAGCCSRHGEQKGRKAAGSATCGSYCGRTAGSPTCGSYGDVAHDAV